MKVAHIGNVASNGYLNAKLQNLRGIDATSYDAGGANCMWVPWWEDALFDERGKVPAYWQWSKVESENSFKRPPWAKILAGNNSPQMVYDTQESFEADIPHMMSDNLALGRPTPADVLRYQDGLSRGRLSSAEQQIIMEQTDMVKGMPSWAGALEIASQHDLTVLYGPFAQYGIFFPSNVPYITFEHSTMRYTHLFAEPQSIRLALAYQKANWNIITNADCWEAALCLGIDGYSSFIPHPLDTEKFRPYRDELSEGFRETIIGDTYANLVVYAPARHAKNELWGTKRNDRYIYAFRDWLLSIKKRGSNAKPILLLSEWGDNLANSKELVETLSIAEHVAWMPPVGKVKASAMYRASDIVLDQFSDAVGSFGAVTIEALACGIPVVTHYDGMKHNWCREAMGGDPPVWSARSVQEITRALEGLEDAAVRDHIGARSAEWVNRAQSADKVTDTNRKLYEQVLNAAS